jgi:hypothetical protein
MFPDSLDAPRDEESPSSEALVFLPEPPMQKGLHKKTPCTLTQERKRTTTPPTKLVQVRKLVGGKFGCTICTIECKSSEEARLHAERKSHACPECLHAPLTNSGWSSHVMHQHRYKYVLVSCK